jgi:hypothetical protein
MHHDHPELFKVILEQDIKHNNTVFFQSVNSAIYIGATCSLAKETRKIVE